MTSQRSEPIAQAVDQLAGVALPHQWRYSEDLDYARRSAGGIGEIFDRLRAVAEAVGSRS